MSPSTIRVGLLGCGTVGSALVRLLQTEGDAIESRTGLRLEVTRVAVRNLAKGRDLDLADSVLTDDASGVVADPDVDVVVEVIGGIEPARSLILEALKSGKPVITANKELLANYGADLFTAAEAAGVDLLFEAAVAGAIPIMRPLRESLLGERITRVMGIVNGTTNYILTRMTDEGASYADALAEAQRLGFAESDPAADVEGFDAGAKAAIIATVAFGAQVVADDVYLEGITGITAVDIAFAGRLGYVIKLLAIAEQTDGSVAVRVHPAMVPKAHPLASVSGSFNAVFVQGDAVGDLMFYGRGAGGEPTASAVLGDLIDAAGNLRGGVGASLGHLSRAKVVPIDDIRSEYYINLEVLDRPGVLAAVAGVFGQHGVSIRSMEQEVPGVTTVAEAPAEGFARLIFITHVAREGDVQATLAGLGDLEAVHNVGTVLRVVGND